MPRKTSKTRKQKGKGRKDDVAAVMKEVLPEIPAERVAHFEEIIPRRFNFRSQDRKWRREDEFRAYHQNPRNIGLGVPFTAEQIVRYYADGFRNSEVRPDGLEKTLPGTTKEWYMLLPGGGWGNSPDEREGPFSANEIGDSIFTNTRLVDRSIAEEDWRPQTLSAYLRGEGRMVDPMDRRSRPRTSLGFRPAGALQALRTERDRFERGWLRGGKKRKTRKRKGGGGDDDKHDEKAVESEMLGWKPGSRVLPDKVSDNILLQRKILMLEDAIKATTERPRYPYNENGLESFQDRPYPNAHTESLHPLGRSVKLAVTKTEGSDAPERSGDSDYQKVMVAFSSPPDYERGGPKWLAGKDFVKNHPFLIGDIIYISAPSPNKEKYEQVLGKITNFEEKFIPYTEIPEGAIANIGVGTSLVPYVYDESYNKIRNEKGQAIAKYHDSVAEDMWTDPEHAAIVAEERAKNPPGMYVLEISYDSNRPPGDSGLIDKYNAFLYRNERGVDFDYYGYGPYNAAQAYVYTKLADRKARLKELKAALAEGKTGTTQKKPIPHDDSGAGPGKVKGGGRKTRKRKGGGDRDESVREEMSGWQPGFDHPDQSVPHHVLRNITEHLEAQEEANPRYRFPYPPRVFKQTMDKVEEAPPLTFPPIPELTEEQKNNMIIQHYTGIPDAGKILPIKFIVNENDPETGTPFKVTYGDAGREKVLYLKAVGDIAWWDETWSNSNRLHQSFKFPRPRPEIDDVSSRILGPEGPPYDDRRGDILVAIDPFSTRNDKVIAEIGEVTRFPMSCDPHRMYTTHCFKIFFKTPKELDFTSGKPDGERRRPYELTLPPQTVIRVIRGRKIDYPPITPRETFRPPPRGGRRKKTRRKRKAKRKKTKRKK